MPAQVIGSISGSGRITLVDNKAQAGEPTPVDLDLEKVGDVCQGPCFPAQSCECVQSHQLFTLILKRLQYTSHHCVVSPGDLEDSQVLTAGFQMH